MLYCPLTAYLPNTCISVHSELVSGSGISGSGSGDVPTQPPEGNLHYQHGWFYSNTRTCLVLPVTVTYCYCFLIIVTIFHALLSLYLGLKLHEVLIIVIPSNNIVIVHACITLADVVCMQLIFCCSTQGANR